MTLDNCTNRLADLAEIKEQGRGAVGRDHVLAAHTRAGAISAEVAFASCLEGPNKRASTSCR